MTVYSEVKVGDKPEKKYMEQIKSASQRDGVFDEECPEYSYEELVRMRNLMREREKSQQITLTISDATVKKAKKYGENYRNILSRLLSLALDDQDLVRRAMT